MNQSLDLKRITEGLNTKYIGRKLFYTETTGSTNDDAKKHGEAGAPEGSVVLSEQQTKGRGRMFRTWITEPGTTIAMTILLRPEIQPEEAPTMTPVLAVSTIEALRELTGAHTEVGLKWPNDIFVGGRKLAGILTEMSVEGLSNEIGKIALDVKYVGKIKHVVAGIGLNVNQLSMVEELADIATSLRMITSQEYSREEIIASILNHFEQNYENFLAHGLGFFRQKLKEYSIVLGREVVVISGLEMVEGKAVDIDEAGNLVLELADGRIKNIIYGDVGLKYKEAGNLLRRLP